MFPAGLFQMQRALAVLISITIAHCTAANSLCVRQGAPARSIGKVNLTLGRLLTDTPIAAPAEATPLRALLETGA